MPSSYSFIDVAVLDEVRERFARGEALIILAVDLEQVIWANGPGAALLGAADIDAVIGISPELGLPARRQIMATSGYPAIGRDRSVLVRFAGGLASRMIRFSASSLTMPDGEPAILLSVPGEQPVAGSAAGLDGLAAPGQFAAFIDAGGHALAATEGFEALGISPETLTAMAGELPGGERVVKRALRGRSRSFPAGLARLVDEPPLHFLVVVDEAAGASEVTTAGESVVEDFPQAEPPPSAAAAEPGADPEIGIPAADQAMAEQDGTTAVIHADGLAPEADLFSLGSGAPSERPQDHLAGPAGEAEPHLPDSADAAEEMDAEPDHDAWYFAGRGDEAELPNESRPAEAVPPEAGEQPEPAAEAPPSVEAAEAAPESAERESPPAAEHQPGSVPERPSAPIRFVWRTDADGRLSTISPEFASAIGTPAEEIVGKDFTALSEALGLRDGEEIAALFERRDTWSGKTLRWPLPGTNLLVPVDLAALPVYSRQRRFEGFRGFGVARFGDAVEAEPTGRAVPADAPAAEEEAAEADPGPSTAPTRDEAAEADPFQGEVPALKVVAQGGRRSSDKVIHLAERRPAAEKSLSPGERSAFREIGERLKQSARGEGAEDQAEAEGPADEAGAAAQGPAEQPLSIEASPADSLPVPAGPAAPSSNEFDAASHPEDAEAETAGAQAGSPAGDDDEITAQVARSVEEARRLRDSGFSADWIDDGVGELFEVLFGERSSTQAGSPPAEASRPVQPTAEDEQPVARGTGESPPASPDVPDTAEDVAASAEPASVSEPPTEIDDAAAADEAAPEEPARTSTAGAAGAAGENAIAAREDDDAPVEATEPALMEVPQGGAIADAPATAVSAEAPPEADVQPAAKPEAASDQTEPAAAAADSLREDTVEELAPSEQLAQQDEPGSDVPPIGGTALERPLPDSGDAGSETSPAGSLPTEALALTAEGPEEADEAFEAPRTASEAASSGNGISETPVLDRLPLALLVLRGDVLHYANPEFLKLAGYPSLAELEAAGGLDALFAEPLADEAESDRTLRLRSRDGAELPVEALLRSIPWQGGSALMLLLRPAGEAPAGKGDEPPAAELQARIAELRTIIDTATDGVVLIRPDGTIASISRPAEALFGFDSEEIEGKPFTSLFAIESQRAARDYLNGLSDHGVASVLNDGREVIGRESQGRFIPLFMTVGRLPNEGGFCAVLRDITQWKRAEEELTQARAVAERASSQKTEFLARISHEIRTPLNAIIGFSELMMDERFGPIGNDRYRDYLRDINRSGSHVLDLVNDLLDISKIEAGQQEMNYEAVSLNDTLAETVAMMQPQANRERVIIRSSFASRLPEVVADLRSVRQIALNLLSNAIRYTQAGGQVIVSTAYEPSGDIVLRVRDTGIGMSAAEIEQALKPFKQINALKRGRGDGTGLGLPLTKAMVEANRAHFAIASTPGEGTLVEITFPATRVLAG